MLSALCRLRSMASVTSSSTRTDSESSSGSSFCTRERSMSSWTRLVSRVASFCIRPAKALHRLRVVGGVQHRLREQRERADRGLEFVADVGDEVAPHRLDPAGLRQVLHQQEDQPGAEWGDPRGDREGITPSRAAPGQVQLHLPYLAVPSGVPGHLEHGLHGELAAAHQAQRVGGGAGLDDGVALVQHHGRGAQHRQYGVDTRGQPRLGVQGGAGGAGLLPLAPPERQHRDHTGTDTGDRCCRGDSRINVHTPRLCASRESAPALDGAAERAVAQCLPARRLRFTVGGRTGRISGAPWERRGRATP